MAENKKNRYHSSSQDRRVTGYLKHRNYMMFEADRQNYFMRSESAHVDAIINKHYEALPEEKQKQLIEDYYRRVTKSKNNKQP